MSAERAPRPPLGPDEFPCSISRPHLPHEWTPAMMDPFTPQVVHVGMAWLPCPGVPS